MKKPCKECPHVIRNRHNDTIVEFMYGEDNMDPSKLIQTSKGFSFIDINHVCDKLNNDVEWNRNLNPEPLNS